jgi:pimeloyl-ACP methyl ester carboxylesterase
MPVALIHGFRGASSDWAPQLLALRDRGNAVYAPDLPGLGERASESFSIGESIATIADTVRTFDSPPLLIGIGVGAHLAIEYAALAGNADGGLAGIAALGCGIRPLGWLLDSYRIASDATQLLPDKGAAVSDRMADIFVRTNARTDAVAPPTERFDEALRQLHTLETPAALRRIDAPVWLVNGQFDRLRLQERGFLRAARDGHFIRVPGERLAGGIRDPQTVTRTLVSILGELEHAG